ncbi:MAG: peptidase, partial [Bacteroidia bacterium]|nr:peptidase [Bacteroidia bacterium]
CGLATAFWQANPTLTNMEVIQYLKESGTQVSAPDTLLGYGVPNFVRAHEIVKLKQDKSKRGFNLYPQPPARQLPPAHFAQ